MASKKHVDMRKIENFVGNNWYPEYITKDREKKKLILEKNALTWHYLILFCLQKTLGSTNFSKKYLFTKKKRLPGAFISWETMTG